VVVRGERCVNAAIVEGARTDFRPAGGELRELSPGELAERAVAGLDLRGVVHVVAACAVPAAPEDLELARRLTPPGARATQVGGLDAAGLEALAVGAAFAADGHVLVVGADSASRAPYWVPGARWGAAAEPLTIVDPLAAVLEQAGVRAAHSPVDRGRADAWARGDAALKPLFAEDGAATAGTTALPADGAAAALLAPIAEAPAGSLALLAAAGTPGALLGEEPAAVEVHEGTAAEALAVADALGVDPAVVNARGGAITLGHPVAASGIAMALRLRERLQAAGGGAGLLVGPGIAIACRLT
jgi:acetyl-CoA acetyltransferase